jgi:uncharacterized membrane protein
MVDIESTATRRRKPWAVTLFGLLAAGGLIAMPFLAGPQDAAKMPDLVRFVGHFHPVLLHLPIGIFSLIVFQEFAGIFNKRYREQVVATSMLPLFLGATSAIVAVLAGFALYHGGEEYTGNALADKHLWTGLAFAVAAVITYILKSWAVAVTGNPLGYQLLLFSSMAVMGFASHQGASMTHGETYLTDFAPDPIRAALGLKKKEIKKEPVPPAADAIAVSGGAVEEHSDGQSVYVGIVAPILEQRCVQCHKESKSKGKFRMDSYELLAKGGKNGPGFKAGNAADSQILVRMQLPKDDEEHMPPDGKKSLEAHEIAVIKWWIENGADAKKTLKDFTIPAPIQEALTKILPAGSVPTASAEAHAVAPPAATAAPDKSLESVVAEILKAYPGAITFEFRGSNQLTFTAASLRGAMDDTAFKKLLPVLSQLTTLDLSNTKITDDTVAQLAPAKDLRMIRLSETGITDVAIETLVKLPALGSINLYGTKVTDAGVAKLAVLTQLKRLYLWQTSVTPEAIKALKEKLPGCEIISGIDSK